MINSVTSPDLPFFPFFSAEDKRKFFSLSSVRLLDAGEVLQSSDEENCCYILVKGSGRLVQGRTERVIHSGTCFGVRPFYSNDTFSKFIALYDCELVLVSASNFSELLLSDFTWYRGYSNLHRFSAFSHYYSGDNANCEIVGVSGGSHSGKSLFISSLLLCAYSQKRILVIDASSPESSRAISFAAAEHINDEIANITLPISMTSLESALVNVDDRLSFLTLNSLRFSEQAACVNSIVQLLHKRFDCIIIEFDNDREHSPILARMVDSLFYICSCPADTQLGLYFLHSFLRRGQRFSMVSNSQKPVPDCNLVMKHLPSVERQNIEMLVDYRLFDLSIDRTCLIVKPSVFSAIHLSTFFKENFDSLAWNMISTSLYSAVVSWFYSISESRIEFRHLMRKFFAPQMQNIFFSVQYPDKALYSSRYISSFFYSLRRKKTQKNIQIAYALSGNDDEQILINAKGYVYPAASAMPHPWVLAPSRGLNGFTSQCAGSEAIYRSLTLNLQDCAVLGVRSVTPVSCGLPIVTEQVAKSFDFTNNNELLRNIVIDVSGGKYSIREDV